MNDIPKNPTRLNQVVLKVQGDSILPFYPCGVRGQSVNVNLHGTKMALNKFETDWKKHKDGKGGKKACVACRTSEGVIFERVAVL